MDDQDFRIHISHSGEKDDWTDPKELRAQFWGLIRRHPKPWATPADVDSSETKFEKEIEREFGESLHRSLIRRFSSDSVNPPAKDPTPSSDSIQASPDSLVHSYSSRLL
jgi:hypothetical protein